MAESIPSSLIPKGMVNSVIQSVILGDPETVLVGSRHEDWETVSVAHHVGGLDNVEALNVWAGSVAGRVRQVLSGRSDVELQVNPFSASGGTGLRVASLVCSEVIGECTVSTHYTYGSGVSPAMQRGVSGERIADIRHGTRVLFYPSELSLRRAITTHRNDPDFHKLDRVVPLSSVSSTQTTGGTDPTRFYDRPF